MGSWLGVRRNTWPSPDALCASTSPGGRGGTKGGSRALPCKRRRTDLFCDAFSYVSRSHA
ncbi:hypothetical protein LUTEI9C_150117 [Luteimonas sp. 9C]|nr:hypothetical protein LUTEI9C_150117 [Luteimonas sp. 9C]